ncbi:E3 ubiquitin-protein ligase RMA1H1-like [Malania oleifera]|uniref:E3 ubiquitin-protein ligase RMA1H1-like n=1 Tax=Malania oleifera TaxID=397392 RepID=UPI0025ADA9FC|nr:E3 ubiquitin-protein ligase RMA1H1-like [Malania oleifera]XP_057954469.1 E3 ubiquitin-protein ligase RMA1H1-like [Malania oleifera]XP_057954470.1 E3 ubiquitin-protein ligase RMA1H1-like [Malania oleifera]
MSTEQYIEEAVAQNDSDGGDDSSLVKWKPVLGSDNNHSGGFECNICLEFVQDPVVTLCGHLYCWPCIYRWLHLQSISNEISDEQRQQCPVCKAEVSHTTLVPIYGRGETTTLSEAKTKQLGIAIPRRPAGPACGVGTLLATNAGTSLLRPPPELRGRDDFHQSQPYRPHLDSYSDPPMLGPGLLGEMIYARVFGNSPANSYSYANSYHLAGTSHPRVRRHLAQADRSLGRICFFLCCCVLSCLLLF